jgi:hypothetical protein
VIASSTTVLANLAYVIGAIVVAVIIGLLVWLRHRQPKSVDANMASFRRGLSALAPDPDAPAQAQPRPEPSAIRPLPSGLTHVRLEADAEPAHAGNAGEDTEGGRSG